jgi:hypothetical protein
MNHDLKLAGLPQFTGTESHARVMGALLTDGVRYVMENGYSWFVTDFLAIAKFSTKLKAEPFCTVELIIDAARIAEISGTTPDTKAVMLVTDGNYKTLYRQNYDATDAKAGFKMFFTDNVLMLASEY